MANTPAGMDVLNRFLTVVQGVDGAAYSGTVRNQSISGTYQTDLSSDAADRVRLGWDGPGMEPPYVNVFFELSGTEPRDTCNDMASGLVEFHCFPQVASDSASERLRATMQIAHDITTAIQLDWHDGNAGTLKALKVEDLRLQTALLFGQDMHSETMQPFALLTVGFKYPLPGGVGL